MIHDLGLPFSEATIIQEDQVFIQVMELGWCKINVCVYTGCINLCYIKYILHNKTGEIIMEHQDCNLLEKITFQSSPLSELGVTPHHQTDPAGGFIKKIFLFTFLS